MINEATANMGELNKVINAFTVYKFIRMIVTPFRRMPAYKYGIIDDKGNFIRKIDTLTKSKEIESVDPFNRLIINIKKIIAMVPDPTLKARLTTLPTAMLLLKDEAEKIGADGEYVLNEIKKHMIEERNVDIDQLALDASFELLSEENDHGR